jgi:hypothetical protein
MGIDKRPKETFGVVAWDRQLFGEVRLAGRLPFLAAKEGRIGSDVGDVDAVRSSIPAREDAAVVAYGGV